MGVGCGGGGLVGGEECGAFGGVVSAADDMAARSFIMLASGMVRTWTEPLRLPGWDVRLEGHRDGKGG